MSLPKLVAMRGIDLDRLEKAAELLGLAFYGLMLVAAAAALSAAPGWGFVMLVLGGAAHVGRASFEEFAEAQRARRAAAVRRTPQPGSARSRRPSRPGGTNRRADEFAVTAAPERRAVKLGR